MEGEPVAERLASGEAKFVVRAFRPEDLEQVAAIFVDGSLGYPELRDSVGYAEYIQLSLDSDLRDVHGTYVSTGGNFWVATPVDDSSHVVGMVGLERKSEHEAELRRLSVKTEFQRFGIARLLVSALEQCARVEGFRLVRLTTGLVMDKAQAFYTAAGYTRGELSEFPRGYFFFQFEKHLQ
jgi:ribosomal protein S18 acetylase RimI-like enzyme